MYVDYLKSGACNVIGRKVHLPLTESRFRIRVARILWGIIPWMMVAAIGAFIVVMGKYLIAESGRLADQVCAAVLSGS